MNIDSCRIGNEIIKQGGLNSVISLQRFKEQDGRRKKDISEIIPKDDIYKEGRYPANIIIEDTFKDLLDEQSGYSKSSKTISGKNEKDLGKKVSKNTNYGLKRINAEIGHNDEGGASRYFKNIPYEELDNTFIFKYNAKASPKERGESNNHPTVKPKALMKYLIKMFNHKEGLVIDPFAGSGTTMVALKELNAEEGYNLQGIGIELEPNYVDIINSRLNK